ncbi:MAG: FitA-like ribbon-helix-helix domain-containing protein [Methylococcales bacterium]
MSGITIKNIPDDLYQRLVATARIHHRSLAKEIVAALERRG